MYDKEKIYDDQIYPLMNKIIEICKENEMMMFASFYLKEATEETEELYCTTCLSKKNRKLEDLCKVAYYDYAVQKPYFVSTIITTKS